MTTRRQTEQLKRACIEAMAEYGNVTTAARMADVERPSIYRWLESDPAFAAEWREAEKQSVEVLEQEARRRAVEGVDKPIYQQTQLVGVERQYSDTLLIVLLKAHAPEKYRERYDMTTAGQPMVKEVAGVPLDAVI